MTGGLLSLVCYGCDDLFLTGVPQITFFKNVYRRYTNFAIESINIGLNGSMNFGNEYEIIIPPIGDAIGKTVLSVVIPETYFNKSEFGLGGVTTNTITSYELDYETVKTFMIYNTEAYRIIMNDSKISTITVLEMYNDAAYIKLTPEASTAISNFNNLFDINEPNITIRNKKQILIETSNIFTILDYYYSLVANGQNASIDTFLADIDRAIKASIECQKYFFDIYNVNYKQNLLASNNNLKFAWNNNLGHVIIDKIDVLIGGELIDRQTGDYFEHYYQRCGKKRLDNVYNKMIGNISTMTTYDTNVKPKYELLIPLNFWFNKNYGSSYPLVAMQYNNISIKIKLKDISYCGYVEDITESSGVNYLLRDLWNNKRYILQTSLYMEYIFFDNIERKKFAQSAHEYLIEQTQTFTDLIDISTNENTINYSIKLDIKHPVRELIWFFQKNVFRDGNNGFYKCRFNDYSLDNGEGGIMLNGQLLLNGYEKLNIKIGTHQYYNYIQPYQHHKCTPSEGLYCYCFAYAPEELQPSGTCNMSRFLNQVMKYILNQNSFNYYLSDINPNILKGSQEDQQLQSELYFNLDAVTYNVLRISGGYAALAFSF